MAEVFDFGLQQHKIKMDGKFFENNLFAVAGDTGRRLEVQLLNSDNMVQNTTGISLRLNADVAGQATYAEAVLVDATKGLYELDLPNGMLIAPGNWQFQWQIIDSLGEKLHSFAFMGTIGSNLSEGGIEAVNFYFNVAEIKEILDSLKKDGSITFNKLSNDMLNSSDLKITANTTGKTTRKIRHLMRHFNDSKFITTVDVYAKIKVTKGPIPTGARVNLYGNDVGDLDSNSLGVVSENVAPLVSYNELYRELTYSYKFTLVGDKKPKYLIASLEIMNNVVLNSEVSYEVIGYSLKINEVRSLSDINKPYVFDVLSYSSTGGVNDGLVTERNLVNYLKNKNVFLSLDSLDSEFRDSLNVAMNGKIPSEIKFTGTTKDKNGLFTTLMFDVKELLDNNLSYVKNNEMTLTLNATNLVNSQGIAAQFFNNNDSNKYQLSGGQAFSNTVANDMSINPLYTKRFGLLTGLDRYIRVTIHSKWVTELATQSGKYSNVVLKIGDIDLSPYFMETYGLIALNTTYSHELVPFKDVPVSAKYINDQLQPIKDELVNKGFNSLLAEKTGDFIGDSITEENFRTAKNYHKYISERTGMTVVNHGISGSGWYNRYNIADTITTAPDFFVWFLGTNDWGNVNTNNLPLGALGDTTSATVAGCIYLALTKLKNKFPTTPMGIITPLPRLTSWGSLATPNTQGYTLEQLANLEIQFAKHFSLPYLDLYHESNLPVWIPAANDYYFKAVGQSSGDGLHPNDAGHELMSYKIQPWMENNLIKS